QFVGLREDLYFEAKSAPYELASPDGRWELAKDVSALANAEGGFIVIGLATAPVPDEHTDSVTQLALLPETEFNILHVEGIIREYLYPHLEGLEVRWVEDIATVGQGVGVIYVPPQALDRRSILVNRVIDEGTELRRIVF